MNRERLQELSRMLRALEAAPDPEKMFNMGSWNCNTSACALGHACFNPTFKKQGLRLNEGGYTPEFAGHLGFSAGAKFFDISFETSEWLFDPDAYNIAVDDITPSMVADRVDDLLAENEGE